MFSLLSHPPPFASSLPFPAHLPHQHSSIQPALTERLPAARTGKKMRSPPPALTKSCPGLRCTGRQGSNLLWNKHVSLRVEGRRGGSGSLVRLEMWVPGGRGRWMLQS